MNSIKKHVKSSVVRVVSSSYFMQTICVYEQRTKLMAPSSSYSTTMSWSPNSKSCHTVYEPRLTSLSTSYVHTVSASASCPAYRLVTHSSFRCVCPYLRYPLAFVYPRSVHITMYFVSRGGILPYCRCCRIDSCIFVASHFGSSGTW